MEAFSSQYWKCGQDNKFIFLKATRPICCREQSIFVLAKHFSRCVGIPFFKAIYKNIKKFVSKIFKRTRSGKSYLEGGPRIEGYVNKIIQDKYNLTPKHSPGDYADMLLTIKNIYRIKMNTVLSEIGTVKIWRRNLQGQYQMVCVTRA